MINFVVGPACAGKSTFIKGYFKDSPIECYNLFLYKREYMEKKELENIDKIYQLVRHNTPGKFIRSYKTLEQAKSAAMVRNEWCGWGNVDKKNVHKIDYDKIRTMVEDDDGFCILQY